MDKKCLVNEIRTLEKWLNCCEVDDDDDDDEEEEEEEEEEEFL